MANYNVYYSDPGLASTPIVVVDGTLNTSDTSLKLPGQNYPGYGPALSEDLVHILENFASSSPPNNPIQGQLWYNTSDPLNKRLFVNDGTAYNSVWSPVNGVHQSASTPTNASVGDIWVNTALQQLNIYNGSTWILVGPAYSGTTKTGPYASTIVDVSGATHNIIINYVNGIAMEIISPEAFTPLQSIDGFVSIKIGTNITAKNFNTASSPVYSTVNGTANSAKSLLQSSSTVPVIADSFARLDVPQTFNQLVTFGGDTEPGIQIGSAPTFQLKRINQFQNAFVNTYGDSNTSGGDFVFITKKNKTASQLLTLDGNSNKVYVGYSGTKSDLIVNGSVTATIATVNSLVILSTLSNYSVTSTNALFVNGGAGIGGSLLVTGEHILRGALTVGNNPITAPSNTTTSLIVPSQDQRYDLGGDNVAWRNVYARTYQGPAGTPASFAGIATQASQLATPFNLSVSGALETAAGFINVTGQQGDIELKTRPTKDLVYLAKDGTTATTAVSDQLLIYRNLQINGVPVQDPPGSSSGNGQLFRQQKADFLQDLYASTIQTGSIIPFAGAFVSVHQYGTDPKFPGLSGTAPQWLLCDGSLHPVTQFPALAAVFTPPGGGTYVYGGDGAGNFRVPDLRNQGLATPAPSGSGYLYLNYIIKT